LDQDGEADVVAPAAADLQVPGRVALAAEASSLGERDRSAVVGLDVGLEAVKLVAEEGLAKEELEALAHEAPLVVGDQGVVADEPRLQRAAHDLGDVDDAGDGAVIAAADQVELDLGPPADREPAVELRGGLRRRHPGPVKATR